MQFLPFLLAACFIVVKARINEPKNYKDREGNSTTDRNLILNVPGLCEPNCNSKPQCTYYAYQYQNTHSNKYLAAERFTDNIIVDGDPNNIYTRWILDRPLGTDRTTIYNMFKSGFLSLQQPKNTGKISFCAQNVSFLRNAHFKAI